MIVSCKDFRLFVQSIFVIVSHDTSSAMFDMYKHLPYEHVLIQDKSSDLSTIGQNIVGIMLIVKHYNKLTMTELLV